jgi:VWFA-related protein
MKRSLFFFCFVASAWAQTPSDRLTLPQVRVAGGMVQAVVSVVDEQGVPVQGLGAANLTVALDGRGVKDFVLKRVGETDSSISVVLAIDISGSMKGERIRAARSAATEFVRNLSANDYCALLVFGSSVQWLVEEFTRDKQAVASHLARIEATDPKTVLNEALLKAVERAKTAPTNRVAVVVLTDGRDDGSVISLDQAAREAQWRSLPIYALGFGDQIDREALRQITTLTGGRFFAGAVSEVNEFYSTLFQQLASQYTVEFEAGDLGSAEHKLSVELHYRGVVVPRDKVFRAQAGAVPISQAIPQPPRSGAQPDGGSRGAHGQSGGAGGGAPLGAIFGVIGLAAIVGAVLVFWRRRKKKEPQPAGRKCLYCAKPLAEGENLYCAACSSEKSTGGSTAPAATGAATGVACLEVLAGPRAGERVALPDDGTLTIGRKSDRGLIITGDPQISREHCTISRNAGGKFVIANEGPNGTFLNGRRIEAPETLQDGDKIGLGSDVAKLVFHDRE